MYRLLNCSEIACLEKNANRAEDWSKLSVDEAFDCAKVYGCSFMGEVKLGAMGEAKRECDGMALPVGLYNSVLCDCTIGDNCAVHNVRYLSHYNIGDNCVLFNIDEMTADNQYAWLEPMNECGGRRILPFNGMRIADAYLWARYRDKAVLMERLESFAREALETPNGSESSVGPNAVIRNTRQIHNVAINSHADAPTSITNCVVLSDGVVGYGCHLEDGCMARRFVLGENVHLEFGARLNDAVVGDNSTVARCEVGCSIIFPAHEQHHNNSFLIAAVIKGQSNVAAGSTIGSNHNGRTADNEISAGRGFWPGLCSSFKHSSRFASYCLLAKGAYPNELDISLPFALVSNNAAKNQLEVMPAYWWMYNMYALNRNEKKFAKRDKRYFKQQHIEFTPLAPDTAEEIVCGRELLRSWTEKAYLAAQNVEDRIEVTAPGMEKGRRKVVILKAAKAYAAYEDMLVYYAMQALLEGREEGDTAMPDVALASPEREIVWENLGGQLIAGTDLDKLIADIEQGTLRSWQDIHGRYDQLWQQYPEAKRRHAYHLLGQLYGAKQIDETIWQKSLARFQKIKQFVADQVRITREKDEQNPFRRMTYRNDAEMKAVLD